MPKQRVYIEVLSNKPQPESMSFFESVQNTPNEAVKESEKILTNLAGFGVELATDSPPVPMFNSEDSKESLKSFSSTKFDVQSNDISAESFVILCDVDSSKVSELHKKDGVKVFSFLEPELFPSRCGCNGQWEVFEEVNFLNDGRIHPLDIALSSSGVDCSPFRPGVSIEVIRQLLGVDFIWSQGFTGQNVIVAIMDEGVNSQYPVIGGWPRPNSYPPGTAPITSHGSMCAADILVAAPSVRLLDYPIFDRSGRGLDSLPSWVNILNQRRNSGFPHIVSNSYGYYTVPPKTDLSPVTEIDHPINRAVRNVISSGIVCLFSAGNCGSPCSDRRCGNGAGTSIPINGTNSLPEVITIAAVNSRRERIGYSSQGPGTFSKSKPDISAYSHFFGNFGEGRPGGTITPFDSGTSAACPVASGVAALLLSAFPDISPVEMGNLLKETAINLGQPGWDSDTGYGVINAGAAYSRRLVKANGK